MLSTDNKLNVALVYDWVDKFGGAERLLLALNKVFPQASLYTSIYNNESSNWAKNFPRIIPSWLNRFPFINTHEPLVPFIPIAFESFDFSKFDVVISVTSAFSKGILTKPPATHICYYLAPTRFLWQNAALYRKKLPSIARPFWDMVSVYLRFWDQIAANRPDISLSISNYSADLVRKIYKRDITKVIYPPVELNIFKLPKTPKPIKDRDYFLIVSRLVPYKRLDIAIKAFNSLGEKLIIVGDGSEKNILRAQAKKNITFLEFKNEDDVVELYQKAKALVVPQKEDFGLTALEANACGTPVLAFGKGGAVETIQKGKSGEFFLTQTPDALKLLIESTDFSKFSPNLCRQNAERFSFEKFRNEWMSLVETVRKNQSR